MTEKAFQILVTFGMLLLMSWITIKKIKKGGISMVFTSKSAIVKSWVNLILIGIYDNEDVPKLYNLQEVVWGILDEIQ